MQVRLKPKLGQVQSAVSRFQLLLFLLLFSLKILLKQNLIRVQFYTIHEKVKCLKWKHKEVSFPHHLFQSFVYVACDLLWFYRDKSYHEDTTQDALAISKTINKVLNIIMPGN
jgi:hypothetical protein